VLQDGGAGMPLSCFTQRQKERGMGVVEEEEEDAEDAEDAEEEEEEEEE